ncbi:unnamed protein product [Linum tenue]|uniref:Uncharacterized protein n=2 Tax=Linum TaxID=4005 RepID=A0AAV0RKP3_9ROSI|nr:unnamed protein product [Linum tenue]
MGSEEGRSVQSWSVFDRIKKFPSSPEALMAEIDAAITKLESERSTARLDSLSPLNVNGTSNTKGFDQPPTAAASQYDARIADEAYRAGCAAFAVGKLDEALQSLTVSLSKCPPEKTSAVAKLQSLISQTSQQLHESPSVTVEDV